jgi:hypothetical protein
MTIILVVALKLFSLSLRGGGLTLEIMGTTSPHLQLISEKEKCGGKGKEEYTKQEHGSWKTRT